MATDGLPLATTNCVMTTAVATGGLRWQVRWPPVGYPGLSARVFNSTFFVFLSFGRGADLARFRLKEQPL